jgi:Holliday junction resolvase RusA-like endonuclease
MEWSFPISPVAASRPRVSKHGAYFAGPYKEFRKNAGPLVLDTLGPDWEPLTGPLKVDLELYVAKPKTTKLLGPKADIDNFVKAIFDAMNGKLWVDDSQVIELYAVKQWSNLDNGEGYFTLGVGEYNNE